MDRREFVKNVAGVSLVGAASTMAAAPAAVAKRPRVKKVKDVVIYRNNLFYSAFPSVVTRPDGKLLVAFRRAPNRPGLFGQGEHCHVDSNSYLVLVHSTDDAATWAREPNLIYANPFGGSQDPCMVQLHDGSIVCASYGWVWLGTEAAAKHTRAVVESDCNFSFVFTGGHLHRSDDGGESWQGPFIPPAVPGEKSLDVFGNRCPAFNRGAMCQGKDGKLYWAVSVYDRGGMQRRSLSLLVSSDRGETWQYRCQIASNEKVGFNETSLTETPNGDLVAFIRTAAFDDHTVIARSTDGGKSFRPWEDAGFQGHPHYALRLPDKRVLLVYGYRHKPFGIRVRVLNPECTDFKTASEVVLRDDGGGGDLGYPWATMMSDGQVLVVYYFHHANGLRHIAGTILSIS